MFKLKSEEEKLRQAMRAKPSAKPKRSRDSNTNSSFRDHDEGSEDEGGISIAAIKNKYKKGGAAAKTQSAAQIYSDSDDGSDGSDFETRRKKKTDKSKPVKALKESDDEDSGKSGSGTDDEGSGDSKKSKSNDGSDDD